jgi:3-phenylpropionate/trans-cinnamate dioxygenase ferredoxin reductase component
MQKQTFVIVGASLAGASAAAALRRQGFDGQVVLIGEETTRPYERPELSKRYLRGEIDAPVFVHDAGYYAGADIELLTEERADGLDVRSRLLVTSRRTLRYDRLLFTTGAVARRLSLPGADLDGIVTLRSVEDADGIRHRAMEAESIVVVGGGWIGSEVAASLRQLGRTVTLVTPTRSPLEHILGAEVGGVYRRAHEEHGVTLLPQTTVAGFTGVDRVEGVTMADGRQVRADLVVVGVGAAPRTEVAASTRLAVDNGIVVDEHLESSVPGIYAAGDVANAWYPHYGRRLRVEHWDNAKRQGRLAATNLLGGAEAYDRIPYFYSDQYDLGMEYTGYAPRWDRIVIRGDIDAREFIAFWIADGRVVAGMNMNIWNVAPAIEDLVRSGREVDVNQLADVDAPLHALAAVA